MIKISVIIASYNRGEQLMRTLRSLLSQTLDKNLWEVVVINNNSSDQTEELFEEFVASNPEASNMRLFFERKQGLSHARNRGIKESKGEYIAIMDDDEEANTEFVESYMDFFDSHPDAAAAGGKMIALYEYETPNWLSPYLEPALSSTIDLGERVKLFKNNQYPIGGNMAFRRSTIEDYGVFNPKLGRTGKKLLGGEEKDLFNRIRSGGGKIYWTPAPQILHIIPEERLSREYLVKLSQMIGVSERTRTKGESNWSYFKRLFSELVKWAGTIVLAVGYLVSGRPSKGGYLFILRWNVSKGLLNLAK